MCKDEAVQFAERAATVFQDTPGLETSAGTSFESVAPAILARGGTFRIREITTDSIVERDKEFPALRDVRCGHITQLSDVYEQCTKTNSLFSFLKRMPAFDAHRAPNEYFNFTTRSSHQINIHAAVHMCSRPIQEGRKSELYFVVPADRFDNGWLNPQSYEGPAGQANMKKLQDTTKPKQQEDARRKLEVDDNQVQLVATNLVQYALWLDLTGRSTGGVGGVGGGQVRQFSTTPTKFGMMRRANRCLLR